MHEKTTTTSDKKDFPQWTLPKSGRPPANTRRVDKNQTYDTRSGFGAQAYSKNKTSGVCHFGTSDRGTQNKVGTFKDQMTGQAKVKLYHPNF